MKKVLIATTCVTLALGMSSVQAAGDAAKGKEKSAVCVACHGADGNTTTAPIYPKIGGQNFEYMVNAIKAYKSGDRKGGNAAVMAGMAAPLTDEDINNLAAYFSSQTPVAK